MTIFDNANTNGIILPYGKYKPLFNYNKTDSFINTEFADDIIKLADASLETEIPHTPASLFREFVLNGNRTRYEHLYFAKVRMMLNLAIGEYTTKSGKYISKLIDVLWEILGMDTWVLPAHVYNYKGKKPSVCDMQLSPDFRSPQETIDLFSASTASDVAVVWYLLHDEFEKQVPYVINARILYELDRRIFKPYFAHFAEFDWSGIKHIPNNWCPWITSNILCVTALTCKSTAKRKKVCDLAIKSLTSFISGYKEEGGCNEGSSYWGEAGEALFEALLIMYDMTGGKLNFFDKPIIRNIGEFAVKMNIVGDMNINYADCHMIHRKFSSGIYAFGKYTDSKLMMDFGKELCRVHKNRFIPAECNGYRLLIQLATSIYEKNSSFNHRDAYLQTDLQIANYRDSGVLLSFKGGTNNESHNHNDIGTIIVFKDKQPILLDTGSEQYTRQTFGPDRYKIACMRSIYHNTLSFDGGEQLPGGQYYAEDFTYDTEKKTASMILTNAYPKEQGVIYYKKTCSLTKGKATIENELKLDGVRTVTANFMTCAKPVKTDGGFTLKVGKTSAFVSCPSDFKMTVEILPVDEHPGWEASYNVKNLYRVMLTKKMSEGTITFTIE